MTSEKGRAQRPDVDWEAVERHYRAGVLSVNQIAKNYSVSRPAIEKRATSGGWERPHKAVANRPKAPNGPWSVKWTQNESARAGFVYVVHVHTGSESLYKIGISGPVVQRIKDLQCSNPFEVRVVMAFYTHNMRAEESLLHAMFAGKRVRGEWFRLEREDLSRIAQRGILA